MARRSYRKIVVLGKTYEYIFGKSHLKVRGLPAIDYSKLTGLPWSDIEKGMWKRGFSLGPADVARYIKSQ